MLFRFIDISICDWFIKPSSTQLREWSVVVSVNSLMTLWIIIWAVGLISATSPAICDNARCACTVMPTIFNNYFSSMTAKQYRFRYLHIHLLLLNWCRLWCPHQFPEVHVFRSGTVPAKPIISQNIIVWHDCSFPIESLIFNISLYHLTSWWVPIIYLL